MMPPVGSFSGSKAHAPENDNHLTDAEAFFNRRIIQFVKKRVTLMEKSTQRRISSAPEEVLGTALDNDPKRLKAPAYYNEVVFVSPFAKLCSMISENRLDTFQTYAGNKSTSIHLRRCIQQIDMLCSEMRRGLGVKGEEAMVDGATRGTTSRTTRGFTLSSTTRIKVLEAGTTTRIKVLKAGTKRKNRKFHPRFASLFFSFAFLKH
ncbi:hypothetical protein SELMODRAFT_432204 [Selaginella moellendorffii]|uniref:Uncharacterized protein n=1 Tax=Selaginella moellendorffii TaxID=88036 RepID=D8TFA4_SELML|nr:hypothetical protein SELMODRAFT_432204 [Selaginella moellendorffii]